MGEAPADGADGARHGRGRRTPRGVARVRAAGDWPARLARSLGEGAPARIALVGARARALLGDAAADAAVASFASIEDAARAPAAARGADAALLVPDTLVGLERTLGTACRLYPTRLLLFVDGANLPSPERLFAFGFRRLAVGADAELHEYRLHDYKPPPEWLNARFWAHPERFGLDMDGAGDGADADTGADGEEEGEDDGEDGHEEALDATDADADESDALGPDTADARRNG